MSRLNLILKVVWCVCAALQFCLFAMETDRGIAWVKLLTALIMTAVAVKYPMSSHLPRYKSRTLRPKLSV